jgi:bile acid:Na+ symporter, BASS family
VSATGSILEVVIPVVVFYVMFVVGMSLGLADFKRVASQPLAVVLGTLGPFVFLPLCALAIVSILDMEPHIEGGLLLIAMCPGGGISNFFAYIARANTALSVSMTAVSSLGAILMMPVIMWLYSFIDLGEAGLAAPVSLLVIQLLVMILIPTALGMTVRFYKESFARQQEVALRRSSMIAIAGLVIFVIIQDFETLRSDGVQTVLISMIFTASALGVALIVGRLGGLNVRDRFTLGIEYVVQNVAIAVTLAVTVYGNVAFATFGSVYFLASLPLVMVVTVVFRRSQYRSATA